VGAFEQANCIEVAKRVGAELIEMVCKRATVADMDRRERAIDRSTQLIARGVTWVDRVAKTAPKAPSMPANCKVVSLLDYLRR